MSSQSARRDFLKQSTALGVAWWVGASNAAWSQPTSPLENIRFACIGVDGRGLIDRDDAGRHGEIVALCDVDSERLDKAAARYPKAKKFTDYRKLFDEVGNDFDAVTISTPDHSHAYAAIRGLRMGKHCFVQKPMSYTVAEARLMRELAAEKKLCTQMGNQGSASNGLREAVEIIRRGDLGQVKEVHIWTDRPKWPQGLARPEKPEPVPMTLNWDAFLGPAPVRPYCSAYHPFKWRGWIDFGTGALGDMACHTMNMSVLALELFDPVSIEATPDPEWTGNARKETYPKFCTIRYEFGPRGDLGPCTLYWYEGGNHPPDELLAPVKPGASGSLVIGEKGKIYSDNDYHSTYTLLPKEVFPDDFKKPAIVQSPGHFTEFANAIKENKPELALSNFEYAGRLTETVLLGNLALRTGGKVAWDGKTMKVTNNPAGQQFVTREYRKGWETL